MMFSSTSLRIVMVNIFFSIANLYVYANAAELETPLSGILSGDIDGVASNDNFGSAIATSSDGSRVVVGARNHDSTEEVTDSNGNSYFQNDIGSVRVFEYGTAADPTGWSQLGGDIDGTTQNNCDGSCYEGEQFGAAVAISADGNRIVVGAPYRHGAERVSDPCYSSGNTYYPWGVGSVRVLEYGTTAIPTGWSQLGADIDGVVYDTWSNEQFGSAVAMSSDGNRIVVGAPQHNSGTYTGCSSNNNLRNIGTVRVFEYGTAANPTGWSQLGGDIDGAASSERFGSAVAMSADGNRIVVGNSPHKYDILSSVRVYEYGTSASPTDWTQLGSALQSSETSNNYGYLEKNVGASSDCARVVVAFSKSTGYNDKVVRVFEYGTTASPSDWTQIGTDMTGEVNEQFGSAVTMSADGDRIVIGARGGDVMGDAGNYFGTFNDVGFVRVMQYGTAANPSDWSQTGADVFGEAQNDQFGSSVALSGDGNRVAVGAPYNSTSVQQAGHVRVLVTACVENAHVSEGTCRACAPGSTNEAGDVLTQVDTLCDVAYCAAYERVSNHTCVPGIRLGYSGVLARIWNRKTADPGMASSSVTSTVGWTRSMYQSQTRDRSRLTVATQMYRRRNAARHSTTFLFLAPLNLQMKRPVVRLTDTRKLKTTGPKRVKTSTSSGRAAFFRVHRSCLCWNAFFFASQTFCRRPSISFRRLSSSVDWVCSPRSPVRVGPLSTKAFMISKNLSRVLCKDKHLKPFHSLGTRVSSARSTLSTTRLHASARCMF